MELGVEPAIAAGGVAADRVSAPAVLERGVSAPGHFGDRIIPVQEASAGTSSHFGDCIMEPPPLPPRCSIGRISAAMDDGGARARSKTTAVVGGGDLSLIEDEDSSEQDGASSGQSEQQHEVAMERAQKAHAFGQIRLGALEVEASYKGKLLPDFERVPLKMKAISYQREVWTMQELLEHIGWDVKKAVAKSVANTTLSAAGNAVSKLGGQLAAPAGAATRSLFEKKKASLMGSGK